MHLYNILLIVEQHTLVKTSKFKSNQPYTDNFKGSLNISMEKFSICKYSKSYSIYVWIAFQN